MLLTPTIADGLLDGAGDTTDSEGKAWLIGIVTSVVGGTIVVIIENLLF